MKQDPKRLSKELAAPLVETENIENLNRGQLVQLFKNEPGPQQYAPESHGEVDPRSGEVVLFNPSRAARPNTYQTTKKQTDCPICGGETTGIIDYAELSEGFSFVNKNLFPAIYPHNDMPESDQATASRQIPIWGVHLLQWTSSYHDQDWHNMEVEDLSVVMGRLGAIEKHLLSIFSSQSPGRETSHLGHVSIMKNGGIGSGGSLEHGHQQIAYSNVVPQRILTNERFEQENGTGFSEYLLQENPDDLIIQDFGEAVLLVPYFMRRPYNMILVNKDTSKQYIYQLSEGELIAASIGWKTGIRAMQLVLSNLGKSVSYNVITHNGPGAGLYFEFLPRSQTEGGFEMMGVSVCQSSPRIAADEIRKLLKESSHL